MTMDRVWIIDGIEPEAGQPRRAHATEDGAYAALGRYVHTAGYWSSDWTVIELEIADGSAPAKAAEPVRPDWLDEVCPGPWTGDGDAVDGFVVLDAGRRNLASITAARTTTARDRELVDYLAALVNADRPTS